MLTTKTPKNPKIYGCVSCNFKCSNKKDYNRHILTAKHKMLINANEKTPKNPKAYMCSCGKVYKQAPSLTRHKKTCKNLSDPNNDNEHITEMIQPVDISSQSNIILELIRENNEFKQLVVDQNKQNFDLQSQMVEMFKEGKIINNNTNNNNQQFNINFFLNDTCKDAMNITDFLRDIDVQNEELEYIGNNGYVTGMTKMIMDRLKNMDITKRPIHCTDVKRETMYIKEEGGWCKDNIELSKLRKILSRISMNNYRSVAKWRESHPESEIIASRSYDFCYRMMQALLGNVEDEQIRLDNKIIKTMAKTLHVDKNEI